MRDDFPKQTVTDIAKGVGFRCANPGCARPTVGSNAAQDGVVTIGVAAHICAASPGGPRYSAVQTREARRGKDNGIWLCQNCGRLVDADPKKFTIELLTTWKRSAQDRAFRELVAPGKAVTTEEAARVGSIIAAENVSLDLSDPGFEAVFAKIRTAANADIAAYRRTRIWSNSSVELTLRSYNDPITPPFSISRLPLAVEVAPEVTIVAPPGTGKTTTLLQFATGLLAAGSIIPLYFRLGDWSGSPSGFLAGLYQRSAFTNISADKVLRVANAGRLLLLLDGWNELEPAMRKNLRIELEQIRHNCPSMRLIVTTRQQMLDVPISGPRISIEPLSEDQEMAIARAHSGSAGERIVDDAWRTAGIRDLIRIPLYLFALLSSGSQGVSPATKEELLRLFVQQHERAINHAEILHATLFGCHTEILTALACHLNEIGSTTITESDARRIITTTVASLRANGQISGQPEPISVIEALTSHHTLMRAGTGGGSIAFQHQQFQEWYASQEVTKLMRASARGDTSACVQLRSAVFDQPAWEESILFSVERMSRQSGDAAVVAFAVREALPIDPMLAAEMIYRAAPSVWEIVKVDILAFVSRWHGPGTVDRAVRFMIMTGRPEFESRIWPLATSSDSQIQLPTLRIAPRFRPSVLGPNLRPRIAALPEAVREHLLTLVASESGVDGMDLAAEIAMADPSPKIQAEVVQYLRFRRADRHVASILAVAHDATWALLAQRGYAEEMHSPAVIERLRAERARALSVATDPLERLGLLLNQPSDYPSRNADIAAAIADPRFPIRTQHAGTSLFFARERAPAAVLQGLRQRLEAGLELPFQANELLSQLDVTDDGPIAASILDVTRDNRELNIVAIMAGPKTIAALLDKYLACAEALRTKRNDRGLNDQYQRLRTRLAATRTDHLVESVLGLATLDDPALIASVASIFSLHGGADRKLPIKLDPPVEGRVIAMLRRWADVVISFPASERYQLNEISNAIGRFGLAELLPDLKRLLDEDLARLRKLRDGFMDARARGDIRATSDASMRYGNQYRDAFARIGGAEAAAIASEYLEDRVFGFEASMILKAISDHQLNMPDPSFNRQWPWFDTVAAARADRAFFPNRAPENALAAPIFAAIDRLARPEDEKESQLLAMALAGTALAMPHSNQDALIARVMALPQPLTAKRHLLAAIVLDGQILDVSVVMQGIDEWLQDADKNPQHAWHKKQNTWEIEPWLELLPYTTQPNSVIEGLAKVKAFYGTGWARHWERVLTAVAAAPGAEGNDLLAALARAHKDIAGDFEWMKAILGRDSSDAVLLYLDLFNEGVFGQGPYAVDAWHLGRELLAQVQKFPLLKSELKKRYDAMGTGPARAVLDYLFGELATEDDLTGKVTVYAASNKAYDGSLESAIRAVALRQEPAQDGSNSYYIYPAPVAQVRKFLFGMLAGSPHQTRLANKCLVTIDVLRDEHGIAASDTRHPDVLSGRPWPTEAGQRQ